MTAVIQVSEPYIQQFQQFIQALPPQAIKLTPIKNDLNEEIFKRISEIKNNKIKTKPLSELSWLRERYVQH
jgi:hypothetical protein